MITERELRRAAGRAGLGVGQAEYEYVILCAFDALSQTPPHPHVLSYALEEILAEKLRSILQRGKARDYYDVWRLLREKTDAFDGWTARRVLSKKCEHKGLSEPSVEAFLSTMVSKEAAAYWSQDLIGQVQGGDLPAWDTVTAELSQLLDNFFSVR